MEIYMFGIKERSKTVREELRYDDGMEYKYTLTVRRSDRTASYGLALYSVKAELVDNEGIHSEASLIDAFRSPEAAFRFFDHITRNLATPIDLPFVFEDERD